MSQKKLIWTESHNQLMEELGFLILPPFYQTKGFINVFQPCISRKRGGKSNILYFVTFPEMYKYLMIFLLPHTVQIHLNLSTHKAVVYVTSVALKYHFIVTSLVKLFHLAYFVTSVLGYLKSESLCYLHFCITLSIL